MKKCDKSKNCPYGNAFNLGYCGLENDCELDKDILDMIDLDADIIKGDNKND